ncbi:MAG: hypothetical protein JNL60_10375 [Bacteroidia bacterium]|nr:hypothetical protein [Bacteroidia bacterium]
MMSPMKFDRIKSKKVVRLLWLLVCLLGIVIPSMASSEKGSSRMNLSNYNSTTNNSIYLEDEKFATIFANINNPSAIGFFDKSYRSNFIFGIDRTVGSLGSISSLLTNNMYNVQIDVQLTYQTMAPSGPILLNTVQQTSLMTFTLNFSGFNTHNNSSAPATETDFFTYSFNYAYKAIAVISAIRIYDPANPTTPLSTTSIPANLYIELQTEAERYYDLGPVFANNSDLSSQYLSASNEIEVKWKRIAGAEAYELEWLWLDEFTYGAGSNPPANPFWTTYPELDFKNNSTRVRTDQNSYRISNIYESGHMFFRIRGVGRANTPSNLVLNGSPEICDKYTDWTWPDISTIASQPSSFGTAGVSGASVPWYIDLRTLAHESDKNWVYTGLYSENGKKKEVVSYYDGAFYNRQSVTKNNSDNVAVVKETYYDFSGRPTVETLPTPVADASIKFYQQTVGGKVAFNFNNGATKVYDKYVFSVASSANACAISPNGLDNNYGTGKYYSSNNPFISSNYNNGYTPNANNFPFTQTEYLPDNTNRVARQGGLGPNLQIEQGVNPKHDTRYLYGTVTQDELDKLFGSEAGYASHYSKKTVIDPDGVVSISYMDQDGRVVATAISGNTPSNHEPILTSNGTNLSTSGAQTETDLLGKADPGDYDTPNDKNDLQSDALIFTTNLTLESAQTYYFDYTLLSTNCYQATTTVCYDCVYDLEFDILDNCGNRPIGFTPIKYGLGTITGTYPNITSNPTLNINQTGGDSNVNFSFQQLLPGQTGTLSVALDAGVYTVLKKLTVNKDALDWYTNDYINHVIKQASAYDTDEQLNLNVAGCEMDCKDCAVHLGTQSQFVTNLLTNNPNLTTDQAVSQYKKAVAACYEPCRYDDYCSTVIEMLYADMSPGGQYAEFTGAATTLTSTSQLSIFSSDCRLPRKDVNNTLEHWRYPQSYDDPSKYFYLEEDGTKATVRVTRLNNTAPFIYDPPLYNGTLYNSSTASPTLIAGTTNEYIVYPQFLFYPGDFVQSFKANWAHSLIKYHPEYPYIEWCSKNRSSAITPPVYITAKDYDLNGNYLNTNSSFAISTSFAYDSLHASVDDLDDIVSSSYPVLFNPLQYDPYWLTCGKYYVASAASNPAYTMGVVHLPNPAENTDNTGTISQCQSINSASPADFTSFDPMYFNERSYKTANNRFLNYKGTGYSIIQVAAFLATNLAGQPGQSMSAQMIKLQQNAGAGYPSASYYPSSTSGVNPTFSDPMDYRWITALSKQNVANATSDDSYKRKAWDNFKSLYASLKQEMQSEAVESYVMNSSTRGCNDCIGKADFDVNSVKYTTTSNQIIPQILYYYVINNNVSSFPANFFAFLNFLTSVASVSDKDWYKYPAGPPYALNKEQVCGLNTKDLYKVKTKRYNLIESSTADPSSLAANASAGIYQQTGLCPNAYDLQGFLNGMIQTNCFFNTSYNISENVPEFSQNLYQAISQVIPTPFVPVMYNYNSGSSTNLNLAANLSINSTNCAFNLTMPSSVSGLPSGINNWSNYNGSTPIYTITQFTALFPSSSTAFTMVVTVSKSNSGGAPSTYTMAMSGSSCLDLTSCTFVPPCKANGNGKALNALLNTFTSNSSFPAPYSGSAYSTNNALLSTSAITPYSYVFTNSFKPLLETPGNSNPNWIWNYNTIGNYIEISDGTTSNKRLKIVFTLPPNAPNISCFQSFQDFQPDPSGTTGAFAVKGSISAVANFAACPSGLTLIKGMVYLGTYNGSAWVYSPMNVGVCAFESLSCNTPEHEVRDDMEKWVLTSGSGFTSMLNSSTLDISNNLFLTPHLRGYLTNAVTNTSGGPQQNYFWWYKDPNVSNTNSDQITGWITVNNSPSAPSSLPNTGCKLVVKRKNTGGTSVSSLLSNIGTTFTLAPGPYLGGSVYDFKLAPAGGATTNDSLFVNTTCFPMKACNICTNVSVISISPPSPYSFAIKSSNSFNTQDYSIYDEQNSSFSINSQSGLVNFTNKSAYIFSNSTSSPTQDWITQTCAPSCNWVNNGPLGPVSLFNFSGIIFYKHDICPTNNCCALTPNRTTTYEQNFNLPYSAFYNLGISTWENAWTSSCTTNSAFNENLNIYIDNTLIHNGPAIPSLQVNPPIPFALNAGMHNIKIVYENKNTMDMMNIEYITLNKTANVTTTISVPCANSQWPTEPMPTAEYEDPCAEFLQDLTDNTADEKYEADLDALKNAFIRKFIKHCLGRAVETLRMKSNTNTYQYTLYYYDQAGNLTRTVPPEGVKPIDLNAIFSGTKTNRKAIAEDRTNYGTSKQVYTKHTFQTTYTYNSLNQLVKQETPDAGLTRFYYDNLGRLCASQNAQQKFVSITNNNVYSYTRYDVLGRIVMTGQLGTSDFESSSWLPGGQSLQDVLSNSNYPFNLTIANNSHVDVTQTYYGNEAGTSVINLSGYPQLNLRNRVAVTTVEDIYDAQDNTYDHASFFSYDIHGNVKTLYSHNYDMTRYFFSLYGYDIKQVNYSYDLFNNNITSVQYQYSNAPDALTHRYEYDADNRLTNVYTTRNSITWDQDAKYYYYLHGPLARTELGQHKVQGTDYAYTINGWLKGVNSEALKVANDMGKDGYSTLQGSSNSYNLNRYHGRDAFGFALNYYTDPFNGNTNDYVPVNSANASTSTYFLAALSNNTGNMPALFTGNVSHMSASFLNPSPTPINLFSLNTPVTVNKYDPYTFLKSFKYDQLNRIIQSRVLAGAIDGSNNWNYTGTSNLANQYAENFTYDQNGNILHTDRKLTNPTGTFDNLTYYYYDINGIAFNPATQAPGIVPTNKLAYVADAGSSGMLSDDLENQSSGNYSYDKIGNLIGDVSESISSITWNAYGKIKSITRSNFPTKPNLSFKYDAMGNRISKTVYLSATHQVVTFYNRDVQGNVIAVYELDFQGNTVPNATQVLTLKELDIYGCKRLGTIHPEQTIGYIVNGAQQYVAGMSTTSDPRHWLGQKSYELGNHLGNVLATVSDRKFPVAITNADITEYFLPEMLTANDYYAFGATMPGRQYNNGTYKYGFNGKENDNEVKGTGNEQDYGMRIYDTRLGRFLSVDPITSEYAELTPYQFASNRPIQGVDRDGEEFQLVTGFISAAVDYGAQVIANYDDPTIKNPWTDNINVSSIGTSFLEGALTSGASIGKTIAIKTTAAVINNIVEVKTDRNGKGVTKKVETNAIKIINNTAVDIVFDGAIGVVSEGSGQLVKKALKKANINGGTISKNTKNIMKAVDIDITRKRNETVKAISYKVPKTLQNATEKATETRLKGKTSKTKDNIKDGRFDKVEAKF